jgi:hypothetical protein
MVLLPQAKVIWSLSGFVSPVRLSTVKAWVVELKRKYSIGLFTQ